MLSKEMVISKSEKYNISNSVQLKGTLRIFYSVIFPLYIKVLSGLYAGIKAYLEMDKLMPASLK